MSIVNVWSLACSLLKERDCTYEITFLSLCVCVCMYVSPYHILKQSVLPATELHAPHTTLITPLFIKFFTSRRLFYPNNSRPDIVSSY
jgi:hypothetical protein